MAKADATQQRLHSCNSSLIGDNTGNVGSQMQFVEDQGAGVGGRQLQIGVVILERRAIETRPMF